MSLGLGLSRARRKSPRVFRCVASYISTGPTHHTQIARALAFQRSYHTCDISHHDFCESLSFPDGRLSLAGVAGIAPAALLWCESEQSSTRSSKKSIPLQPLDPPTSHLATFLAIPLPAVPLHPFLQQLSSTPPQSSSRVLPHLSLDM